ncbi:hypothetical protein [Kangiella shandongensis]|uniref:hypothetical protein n=1 Tax=Kangiella shandongensis TaxID=2763258 RepID=UPI001CBDBCAA|nr:hypothetical protein [Kangiella shandongensis]
MVFNEFEVKELADVYSVKYQGGFFGFPPILVVFKEGGVSETVYFQAVDGEVIIVNAIYEKNPREQFVDMIKANNFITYSEAKKNIEDKRYVYHDEDCPSIKKRFQVLMPLV